MWQQALKQDLGLALLQMREWMQALRQRQARQVPLSRPQRLRQTLALAQ
jgi:hypothetical protein